MSLILGLRRQRQMDLCEFKATLGYTRLIQKQIQVVVAHTFYPSIWESHTFNPSSREVRDRSGMAEWRKEYKWGRDRNSLECGV